MPDKYRLIGGDVIDAMRSLKDESVDLILTSPPYNVGFDYEVYADRMPWPEYYAWCRAWIEECYRVLKSDGRFLLMHYFSIGDSTYGRSYPLMHLNEVALQAGFNHHAVIFWEDTTISKRTAWGSWLSASAPYISSPYEGMLVLYKEQWKKREKGVTSISKEEFMEGCLGVWRISPAKNEKRKVNPAPFPVALADRAIRLFSYEGGVVLDPFVGSGTTVVAAVGIGRIGIGIDLNPKYVEAAREWVESISGVIYEKDDVLACSVHSRRHR